MHFDGDFVKLDNDFYSACDLLFCDLRVKKAYWKIQTIITKGRCGAYKVILETFV